MSVIDDVPVDGGWTLMSLYDEKDERAFGGAYPDVRYTRYAVEDLNDLMYAASNMGDLSADELAGAAARLRDLDLAYRAYARSGMFPSLPVEECMGTSAGVAAVILKLERVASGAEAVYDGDAGRASDALDRLSSDYAAMFRALYFSKFAR